MDWHGGQSWCYHLAGVDGPIDGLGRRMDLSEYSRNVLLLGHPGRVGSV